jgi:uncharacterized protein YndB with AHSA1/START domain
VAVARSEDHFRFPRPPAEVWAALVRVDAYPEWWPWLVSFDGRAFAEGERWQCVVRPPLPYQLRFDVVLDEVEEARFVTATVEGDIAGPAAIDLDPSDDGGTDLRLVSSLAPTSPLLRAAMTVAPPVVRWGHDWVLATGLRQFRDRAFLAGPGAAS